MKSCLQGEGVEDSSGGESQETLSSLGPDREVGYRDSVSE